VPNWHIEYLCEQLQGLAHRVARQEPARNLIVNVPPGTTKTTTCSIMFPAWCWTQWPWMRFITASYSGALSLESAEYCRDLVRSERFAEIYPNIRIKLGKDIKSNFRIVTTQPDGTTRIGGGRYSTSTNGTVTGFHGHVLVVDDPLDPNRAASEVELRNANHWMDHTLAMRKIDKKTTATILIMQRLHQADPTGHMLDKKKRNVDHVSLPGEINRPGFDKYVRPPELKARYDGGLLDRHRMPPEVLKEMEVDLGQYGYAAQVGQNPVPPGGGMFKVDRLAIVTDQGGLGKVVKTVRYWDKAGSEVSLSNLDPAWTVGTKMAMLNNGKFLVMDVRRGRWSSEVREQVIRETAEADGRQVVVWHEQEPGSGGKDSAKATTRNLAGFVAHADRPTGDKVYRADPWSVQVNDGNVMLLHGDWNHDFIEEHRYFPFGRFKDQVDSASGAFSKLADTKRLAGPVFSKHR